MVWMFRFDEVLDPNKLNDSLSQLFQIEGWRRLGGRYRRCIDGKLEVHIPRPFTKERPPLHFTKDHYDVRMSEHSSACRLPRASGKIATYPGPRAFNSLALGPGAPRKFEDFVSSDLPQFSLHITTFTDSTLVSLCHSHMTADLLGLATVVNAWSLILAGRIGDVPPFVGFRADGMEGLWDPPTEESHVLSGKELAGWRLAYWGLWSLYESRRFPLESRVLCIPKSIMRGIMVKAKSQVAFKTGINKTSAGNEPFFTEGDVLAAISIRMMAQNQHRGSTRNIMTMMALDPRTRAKSAFRQDAAYVQNSPTAVFINCRANEALDMSLGELALLVRETIMTQATEEQVKAYTALSVVSMKESNMNVLFGDKDMAFQLSSNWLKANLFEKMDFSPAIVKDAPESALGRKRGHPTYYHSADPESIGSPLLIPLCVVMGMDYDSNIWLSWVLPQHAWPKLLEYLYSFE
ncbi:Fc.00g033880.m01.CDS01 [Cosmosporella sp. VM-42]